MQRKIGTTPPLTALVASATGAAFVVDVCHCAVVAANEAGGRLWGSAATHVQLPILLDRAMPALAVLRDCQRGKTAGSVNTSLTLWTPHGVRRIPAQVRPLDGCGHPGCFLITTSVANSAAPYSSSHEAPTSKPEGGAAAPNACDLATLARIRIAIETGNSDTSAAHADPDSLFEAVRSQSETGASQSGSDMPAASTVLMRLAHEVRTPLAAIAALADVMRLEQFGPMRNARYREYVADIHHSARHALDVVSGMLDPDALKTGRPSLTPTRTLINPVVAASISSMRPLAETAGLRLVAKLAPRLPAVLVDEGSLRQMLLNLIANAIQYAGTGATVTVSTSRDKSGRVVLEVRDNGRGMAATKIARILGPPDKALPAAGDRRGLGLPFTRLLAEANDAELALSAKRGRGTRAAIHLRPAPRPPRTTPAKSKSAPGLRRRSSRRS